MDTSANTGKRVVVFGVFDGVHDGHREFFSQAREFADRLIVIVGRDGAAFRLKDQKPQYSEAERLDLVAHEHWVTAAVLGDEELSTYTVLEELDPDVICLGYDQQAIREDLQMWMDRTGKLIPMHYMKPYKPHRFHSSLLRRNTKDGTMR